MKKIRFQSLVGIAFIFLFCLNIALLLAGLITHYSGFALAAVVLSIAQVILHDLFRRKHSVLRNYPFREKMRRLLAGLSPSASQFLFGDELLNAALSTAEREVIITRAKNVPTDVIRCTLSQAEDREFECLRCVSSVLPSELKNTSLKVRIGTGQCSQPYDLSLLTIGALNQKTLSKAAVLAISEGANIQGCAVNTGRGGISPHLIRGGGDLIWQIAQEDDAFRKEDSSFNEKFYKVTATRPYVKMIEMVLPRDETTLMKRLSGDRLVTFLAKLRTLSGGKPIGIRVYSPTKEFLWAICKSMQSSGINLDFITIDNTYSEDGFDSFAVSNASAPVFLESLAFLRKTLDSYGLPVKILAAGPVVTEYDLLRYVALGASACYCTAPIILAVRLGRWRKFEDVSKRRLHVSNYHRNTIASTIKLMEVCGYQSLTDVKAGDFYRKVNFFESKSLQEIYFNESKVKSPHLFSGLS